MTLVMFITSLDMVIEVSFFEPAFHQVLRTMHPSLVESRTLSCFLCWLVYLPCSPWMITLLTLTGKNVVANPVPDFALHYNC